MTALRALLVAIFGGFIGAAPAAPVFLAADTAGGRGHSTDAHAHSQKRDGASHRPEAAEPPAAAAPPGNDRLRRADPSPAAGTPVASGSHASPALRAPRAALPTQCLHAAAPSTAEVRAGHVDLPPPGAR